MKGRFAPFLILFILLLGACAPSRYVKPLAKDQRVVAFSFGGPLIKFSGTPIPIPFTTLGYAQGLSNKLTLYGDMHLTSALFGNAQADLGTTISVYQKEQSFGITASPALQLAYNLRNQSGFRVWPSLDLNTYFHPGKKNNYFYAGVNSWFELSGIKAHGETQKQRAIPNLQLGYTVVKTKWQHQFELKYLAIGTPNLPGVVDYIGISHKGSFGIYYSLSRKF